MEAPLRKATKIQPVQPSVDGRQIIFAPTAARVINRKVLAWSAACGTYGQGGPGFFGLMLEAKGAYPKEWLILRIWGACSWLVVNDRWVAAHPDQYRPDHLPLYSNFADAKWDYLGPCIVGLELTVFSCRERSCDVRIGGTTIQLTEDSSSRPPHPGDGTLRELDAGDDLRRAWILAAQPWVSINI